jgi:soluble P-type ATPase
MNKKIIILLILILFSCKKEKSIGRSGQNWIVYNSKDSIPKQLYQVLKAINGDEKIADKDENYEATDNISNESIPTRQLRLLAKNNDKWRLVYEQGGIGTYQVYIECKIKNDSLFALRVANTLLTIENNDSISKFIKEKKIELKNIKTINK